MSTQKGNASRTRPQKHKNRTVFKNNLHDTSHQTKKINSIHVSDVCVRCKEIIEWKIKYKKYKPLTQPKTCVKCGLKTVRKAYHVMCSDCGKSLEVCTKCCQKKEIIQAPPTKDDQIKLDSDMKALLQSLPERKRRTFLRYMDKLNQEKDVSGTMQHKEEEKNDLMIKLRQLKVSDDDDYDFDTSSENDSDNNKRSDEEDND